MNKKIIYCNIDTFVLNHTVKVIEDSKILSETTALISDIHNVILSLASEFSISHIILSGNIVYCNQIKEYILTGNTEKYRNKLNLKIDILDGGNING